MAKCADLGLRTRKIDQNTTCSIYKIQKCVIDIHVVYKRVKRINV